MKAAYPRRGAGTDLWKQKVVFAAHADSWDFAKDSIFYLRRSTAVRRAKLHFSNMAANTIKTLLKYGSKYNQNKPQTLKLTVAKCEVIAFWLHKYQRQSISLKQPGWLWCFTQSDFHVGTAMNMKEKEKETSLQLGKRVPRMAIFNVQYSISNIQYLIYNIK